MNDSKVFSPSPTACLAIDGSKIKSIRESKKLTQLYVATCLGVTVDTISRWENGRSPNMKLENAEKLAEVLEISLVDIGDCTATESSHCQDEKSAGPPPASQKLKPWWPLIPVALLLILTYFQFSAPKDDISPQFTANRLLPQHASASQPFPVLIKVQANTALPVSFIVKEFLPIGCQAIGGEPALMSAKPHKKSIKWLSSAEDEDPIYFAYLAKADRDLGEGHTLTFQGEVMVQGQSTNRQAISGNSSITLTNSHWADSNKDQRIDDEEILTIYNSFEVLQDLGVHIDEIRQIWAGKGYRWDTGSEKFIVVPQN